MAAGARAFPRVPVTLLRLGAFAALAGFCLAHYALLVEPAAGGRAAALVAVATLGGAALAASARLDGRAGTAARVGILAAMALLALALTGLAPRLLAPGNWDELGDRLSRGFAGLDSFEWPYPGPDEWVRLTILLAMPLLVVPAAALAFWPARRFAAGMRTLALVPLIAAYGTGVT